MAILSTGDLSLPKHMATGIFDSVEFGSTVAALSGQKPMLFGETASMTFSNPKAEFVGEGAQKGSSDSTPSTVTVKPYKAQVTVRFNEEVQWASEDYQLNVLQQLSDKTGPALSRALDLGIYHGLNPLPGTAFASITKQVTDTTNRVEVAAQTPIGLLDAAEDLVSGVPNGVALDPVLAKKFRTQRDADGRRLYPEFSLATQASDLDGFSASTSDTVSASQEAASATNVLAIAGDFSQIYWGVQRRIGVQLIEAGDPDGQGDLKRNNQIALRAEVVYGWVIGDLDRFAVIEDAVA